MAFRIIASLALLLATSTSPDLKAQEMGAEPSSAQPERSGQQQEEESSVKDAWKFDIDHPNDKTKKLAEISDSIAIEVAGLEDYLGDKSCFDLRLYLDGKAVVGDDVEATSERLDPERCNLETGVVRFRLSRIDRAHDLAWNIMVEKRSRSMRARADISVGLAGQKPLPTLVKDDNAFLFQLISTRLSVAMLLTFAFTLVLFLKLARSTAIIRNPGAAPAQQRSYSLARLQMAFWFLLILWGFLFIFLLKGSEVSISESLLGLMGISAGTFLGAQMIGAGKQAQNGEGSAKAEEVPEEPAKSRGFLMDVLSDSSGIAFHRFQIFAWTLVLGVIFVSEVWSRLSMPEFDATLLGLMGISSGTYVGLKFPEKPKS